MYCDNLSALKTALTDLQQEAAVKGLILLAGAQNRPSKEEIEAVLGHNFKKLLGGFFPEIIVHGERKQAGFVIIPVFYDFEVNIIHSAAGVPWDTQLAAWMQTVDVNIQSVLCFVNAFWPYKTQFMDALYNELGPFVHYLGGGAGSLDFKSFDCIFYNHAVFENAAVLGLLPMAMSIGVAHGWHPVSEPVKVTATRGNTVLSLNWEPAAEVYKSLVEAHSGIIINEDNFFSVAKSYPLGMVRLDDEMIIRDPFAAENGILHLVDEVPEGEYIRIMHGNLPSLLEGARHAIEQSGGDPEDDTTLVFIDCISRVLFMQEQFTEELSILDKNQKGNGVLSIGEIANSGSSSLALYNKTVVVSQWKTNK